MSATQNGFERHHSGICLKCVIRPSDLSRGSRHFQRRVCIIWLKSKKNPKKLDFLAKSF